MVSALERAAHPSCCWRKCWLLEAWLLISRVIAWLAQPSLGWNEAVVCSAAGCIEVSLLKGRTAGVTPVKDK